jgi:hypothetical protein
VRVHLIMSRLSSTLKFSTGKATAIQDMRVGHGLSKVFMTQKVLKGSDVVSILQQMYGEGVPEGMATGPLDPDHTGPFRSSAIMPRAQSISCTSQEFPLMGMWGSVVKVALYHRRNTRV